MGVPFGFSVGDIIAGIGVIKISIEAFSNTRGASKEYKLLSETLSRLSESLELIRAIEVDTIHDAAQGEAVRRAVEQCQCCIDDFLDRIVKYKTIQLSAEPIRWSSKLQRAARKIRWALCKQNDIIKFGRDIQVQIEAISMLLVMLQIHRGSREAGLQEAHRQQDSIYREALLETRSATQQTTTLFSQQLSAFDSITTNQAEILNMSRNQLSTLQDTQILCRTNYRYLNSQRSTLADLQTENEQILDRVGAQLLVAESTQDMVRELQNGMTQDQRAMLEQIFQRQARNFQLVLEQQAQNHQHLLIKLDDVSAQVQLRSSIPPQVLLQQPVVFTDALDRITPVHLEFIDSAEAFVAVLKVRFKDIGLEKLERNEFLLSDEKQNRDLDIRKPWHAVMKPGQYVSMRMVFDTEFQINSCPGCSLENNAGKDQEMVCSNCGLKYRLVEEKMAQPVLINQRRATRRRNYQPGSHADPNGSSEKGVFDPTPTATIADFRRVHLINWIATYRYKCTYPSCGRSFSNDGNRKKHESEDHRKDYSATEASKGTTAAASTPNTSHDPPTLAISAERAQDIANMQSMGFERKEIDAAMHAAFYNPNRAIEYLLVGIPKNLQQERRLPPEEATVPTVVPPAGLEAGEASLPGPLDGLRNNPQFQQLRQIVQQQPHILKPILTQLGAENPQLAQLIGQDPEEFLKLLGEDGDNDAPLPPGSEAVNVTEEERGAIERLCRLGFDRDNVIQTYFACDKNEELAANYLFDQPDDVDDYWRGEEDVQPDSEDHQQPNFEDHQPDLEDHEPDFEDHEPDFQDHQPDLEDHEPDFEDHEPDFQDHQPDLEDHQPDLEDHEPDFEDHEPDFEVHQPDLEDHEPDFEDHEPDFEVHRPDLEDHQPDFEDHEPDFEVHKPDFEVHQPDLEDQQPDLEDHEPDFEDHEPDFEDYEPDLEDHQQPNFEDHQPANWLEE